MLRAFLAGALLLIPCAAASTIVVPIDRPTTQAAVDAAVDGDTIDIHGGVYPGHVEIINKHDLVITGMGKVRLVAPLDDSAMYLNGCSSLSLQKLSFEGARGAPSN